MEVRLPSRIALILPAVVFGTACLFAPGAAEAACDDRSIAASAVRDRQDAEAFLRCAHEFIQDVGVDAAYEAFHNDPRWHSGSTYVFALEAIPDSTRSRSLMFPPNPAREDTEPGMLTDRTDEFGGDSHAEAVRIIEDFGGGWWHYAFTNPVTGAVQPKASYILPVDWNGTPAFIASGVYRRDFPGACNIEEVNAARLESDPSGERLEEFVRCAAQEVESRGSFAMSALQHDERWSSDSVYVFGMDPMGNQVFTGSKVRVRGASLPEWEPRGTPADEFQGRDIAAVADTVGESYLYYRAMNPGTGRKDRKVTFLKRVAPLGNPVLVGAGYYVEDNARATVQVRLPNGAIIDAELAITAQELAKGMKFRTVLAADRGMLFVFGAPAKSGFWMYECQIPLDIIWMDGERRIVEIVHSAPPCTSSNPSGCPVYGGTTESVYVLELAGGEAKGQALRLGDRLDF